MIKIQAYRKLFLIFSYSGYFHVCDCILTVAFQSDFACGCWKYSYLLEYHPTGVFLLCNNERQLYISYDSQR